MQKHFSADSIFLDEIKTHFGDLELMLLPAEQTVDELERVFTEFITAFNDTD